MIFSPMFMGFVEAFFSTVIFFVFIVIAYNILTFVETKYFPVIDAKSFKLEFLTEAPGDLVYVKLKFDKLRECSFDIKRMSWYKINDKDHFERVFFVPPEQTGDRSRPLGKNNTDAWDVNLGGLSGFNKEQKIVFYHNCNPFWTTKTEIVIPDVKNR